MRNTSYKPIAMVLFCAAAIFGSGGPQVDASDLPPIQNESLVESGVGQQARHGYESRWDSLEQRFLLNLTTSEREVYYQLKEHFILQRAKLTLVRDSIAALTPEQRQIAIQVVRDRIMAELKSVETQVMDRLNQEQRVAWTQRRGELDRKRTEIQQHIQQLRQELQDRLK